MAHVLVTGARGMLGLDLCRVLARSGDRVTGLGRAELDVRDAAQVRAALERARPERVIHLAALTDVDACERDPAAAFETNALGARNVALACQALDLELVYVSTLAVFNGDKPTAYVESDAPDPRSAYGRSKHEGEQAVRQLARRHFIARGGWLFGGGAHDKKFVGKVLARARARAEVSAVDDKFGSPTYTLDFARGLARLATTGRYGSYHLVNTGQPASRYAVAQAIVAAAGLTCRVTPVGSEAFPLVAPRPRMEAGENAALAANGWDWMRPWRAALAEYVGAQQAQPQGAPR
jgi:dTDP-4-dehydrorhamnose reductase